MVRTQPLHLDCSCLDLGDLKISQPLCFFHLACTSRMLQLDNYFSPGCSITNLYMPPHVSVGTIIEISQYIFIKETTHKVAENSSTAHDRFRPFWGSL
ncbi:hypothetical protein CSKR_113959, partial [Clonorchis sinensis]